MNILVTGASGFLGKHLCEKLEKLNCNVYISNTKIANLNNIENLFCYNDIKFDYIYHLAAVTKAGDYALYNSGVQWIDNQIINTNILRYWKEYQPQSKMICMGTSCSYSPNIIMSEDNYLLGQPENSLYTYAMTKRMLLVGLMSIHKQFGLNWLYFVPSTLYGPNFELNDNHFIFDLIRNCYNAKYHNKEFVLWGNGEQRRELIYIDDAVDAILQLSKENNQVFNLGSGHDNSINEFAKIICDIYDYDFSLVKHDLNKYVGVKEKKIDTKKIDKFLYPNKLNKTKLEFGILKSVDYFKKMKLENI